MLVVYYVLALIVSFVLEFGVSGNVLYHFFVELFDDGYKINTEFFNKMRDKHQKKANIIYLVPGINAIALYFRLKRLYNRVKNDPAFINNLQEVTDRDMFVVGYKDENMTFLEKVHRFIRISGLFNETKVKHDCLDLGTLDQDELNINPDGLLSKDVVDKMKLADKEYKQDESNTHFYMLTDPYTLSEVYHIDENPIFVQKDEVLGLAFVNATEDQVREFVKKGMIVKPNMNREYHIISLKPFDKTKLRKSLLEIEYFKNPIDQIIDSDEYSYQEDNNEKKRTL